MTWRRLAWATGLRRNSAEPAEWAQRSSTSLARTVANRIGIREPHSRQSPLDLESIHSGHPHVEQQTCGVARRGGVQEVLARAEDLGAITERADQAVRRLAHRSIVVDDRDERSLLLRSPTVSAVALRARVSHVAHGRSARHGRLAVSWCSVLPVRRDRAPASEAEPLHHPHELCNRLRLNLLHDVRAVELDGPLRGRELPGDLLVEQAGDDEWQDLPLARREPFVAFAQRFDLAPCLVGHWGPAHSSRVPPGSVQPVYSSASLRGGAPGRARQSARLPR